MSIPSGPAAWVLLLASAALPISVTSPVRAQDSSDVSDVEARARFESGRLAFESGRFEEALSDFRRAYELSPRPLILYNMGIAYDRLRRDAEALDAFERYLASTPNAANRGEIEARLVILRRQIGAREGPAGTTTTTSSTTTSPPATIAGSERPARYPHYEIWAWVSGGVALAAAIASGALWVVANDRYAELAASCGVLGCSRAQIDASGAPDMVTATNALLITAIVATASTVAALTLLFVDLPPTVAEQARLGIGPGSVHLHLSF
jgi:tetratricopeptide (TPR) repeat protein